uniref:Uncharacterized protein n=1 Tax=Ditylenchus dipsaci TaxID=166011 RepID=A0A915DMM0_9BILA
MADFYYTEVQIFGFAVQLGTLLVIALCFLALLVSFCCCLCYCRICCNFMCPSKPTPVSIRIVEGNHHRVEAGMDSSSGSLLPLAYSAV